MRLVDQANAVRRWTFDERPCPSCCDARSTGASGSARRAAPTCGRRGDPPGRRAVLRACGADLGSPLRRRRTGGTVTGGRARSRGDAAAAAARRPAIECGGRRSPTTATATTCGAKAAEPARPLRRAAGALGGGGLRPRRPPPPQRGRRRPRGRRRARHPRRPRGLRRGVLLDRLRRRQPRRRPGRPRRAGRLRPPASARPPSGSRRRTAPWPRRPTRPTPRSRQHGRGSPQTPPPAPSSRPPCSTASLVVVGHVGDSRAYWLPDEARPALLTRTTRSPPSRCAHGVPRARGRDQPAARTPSPGGSASTPPTTRPRTASRELDGPGWVLVCSDGLWNYCSEAADLAALVHADGATARHRGRTRSALAAGAGRLRQRRRAAATTSPSRWPASDGRPHRRYHPHRAPDRRRKSTRWLSSPPRSSRTSSCPTAAPTCTRSCASRAVARARRGRPARATRRRSSSSTPPGRWASARSPQAASAATAALDEILDGTWFAVIAGNHGARWSSRTPAWPAHGADGRRDPRRRRCAAMPASAPTAARRWGPG